MNMPDNRPVYIYVLIDPRDSEVRYVGSTFCPAATLSRHMTQKSNVRKVAWIHELKSLQLKPRLEVIDSTNDFKRHALELQWVSYYQMQGAKLLNGEKTNEFNRDLAGLPPLWGKHRMQMLQAFAQLLSKYETIPVGKKGDMNLGYLYSRAFQLAIKALEDRDTLPPSE